MLDVKKFWDNKKEVDNGYKINAHTSLCWMWQGSTDRDGYGNVYYEYRETRSHILAYRFTYNNYKKSLLTLHKCNIKGCYNPEHLYQGNCSQNAKDSVKAGTHARARKTHCINGHEFTPDNTNNHTSKKGKFQRICLTCMRNRNGGNFYRKVRKIRTITTK